MARSKRFGPVVALAAVCVLAGVYAAAMPTAEEQQSLPQQIADLSSVTRVEISDGNSVVLSGQFGAEVADDDEMKREAVLADAAGAQAAGEAEIEMDTNNREEQELEVEVRGLSPKGTYQVLLDGAPIGALTMDARGRGSVEFARTNGAVVK